MNESDDRYPIDEARQVIEERLSQGSVVMGIEGLWVRVNEVAPAIDYIADFSPDGLDDAGQIAEILDRWPRDDGFCLEILFVTPA